jgi:hypothetical protein
MSETARSRRDVVADMLRAARANFAARRQRHEEAHGRYSRADLLAKIFAPGAGGATGILAQLSSLPLGLDPALLTSISGVITTVATWLVASNTLEVRARLHHDAANTLDRHLDEIDRMLSLAPVESDRKLLGYEARLAELVRTAPPRVVGGAPLPAPAGVPRLTYQEVAPRVTP